MSKSILRFYRRVGIQGWRNSQYFTVTWRYPLFRQWLTSQMPAPGATVLSIGCGCGHLEKQLHELSYNVIGVDLSYEMLRSASRRGFRKLIQADAHCLPFASGAFDAVICLEAVGYLKVDRMMLEVERVLRSAGVFIITTYPSHLAVHKDYKRRTLTSVLGSLTKHGFHGYAQHHLSVTRNLVTEEECESKSTLLCVVANKRYLASEATRLQPLD